MILSPTAAPWGLRRVLGGLALASLVLLAGCAEQPEASSTAGGTAAADQGLVHVLQDDEDPDRPGYFDFGTVDHGEVVHHTFKLENTEPRPVTIQKVDVGCGCTVARLAKRTVDGELIGSRSDLPNVLLILEPGETAEIALRVDTTAIKVKNIDKLFMVRVMSDSITTPYVTLECHLVVKLNFQVAPERLEFRHMPQGAGAIKPITIKALGSPPGEITGIGELPPGVTATLRESELSTLQSPVWVVDAGFLPPLELGRHAATIVVETAGEENVPTAPLEIQIAGTAVPDVHLSPSRLILRPGLGVADPEDPDAAMVGAELETFLQGHRFAVTGFQVLGDASEALELVVEPVLPDARGQSSHWTLSLSTRTPGPSGSFTGTILLELDDPQYPTLELPYVGLDFDS